MKRTLKLSTWLVLVILTNQLNAASFQTSLDVSMLGTKTFELKMNNLKGDIQISLLNSKQSTIYNEHFTTVNGSFKRTFDLGLFPDGIYSIELIDSEKSQSIPLLIKNDQLIVKTSEKSIHFLPVAFKKDNIVRVNMPALAEEFLDISILNENDEIMYEAKLTGERNLGKVFDFSNTHKGTYKFLLISKAGFVSKEFDID